MSTLPVKESAKEKTSGIHFLRGWPTLLKYRGVAAYVPDFSVRTSKSSSLRIGKKSLAHAAVSMHVKPFTNYDTTSPSTCLIARYTPVTLA